MKEIKINYNPYKILKFFANKFNVAFESDCIEYVIQLPDSFGDGILSGFSLGDGIGVLCLNCQLKDDWRLIFEDEDIPPVQFNFLKKGSVRHVLADDINYDLKRLTGSISANIRGKQHYFQFPKNENIVFITMMVDRTQYLTEIDCLIDEMPDAFQEVFKDTEARKSFLYKSKYSMASSECLNNILTANDEGIVRTTFLAGVSFELLSYQIRQYISEQSPSEKALILRQNDYELIQKAKNIMEKNIQDCPTIIELSKEVGINQTKLKAGFKKVYGQPIKTWLRNKRLSLSKLLLLQDDYSIKEIAGMIGYSNQGHFAKKFEDKYGLLPKDFRASIYK